MRSTRIHKAVIRDETYNRVGQSQASKQYRSHRDRPHVHTPRPVCPKCGIYYLRSLWARSAAYGKDYPHKVGKTEVVIGLWCMGCGYFVQTYKKPEGTQ
jgi:hypothetical protein